ncbi:hypothetical protein AQUCO_11400018v1 [Aquilegia coerulea]|uniref:Uncharacterized protein n=1 Tax=Aquilegia coerulea TaxID=218851 RepID=A0A2G5C2D5_AQUCA|nr:hypothetical protein AQUCO_11400018v1 [Aquilegia coerulea]PIA25459.1 hypothetical protein AQUCO_11400018v1 [Aquilegia coerulea]
MSCTLKLNVLRSLFIILGCFMVATLIYTLYIDGLPFRKDLLTPWMAATLVDFYITILALAAWVFYKVPNWIIAVLWIILLVCFGSITTCAFILLQLFTFSPQDPSQDPMHNVLVRQHSKNDPERKRTFFSVMAARILFVALGCLMLGSLIYTILTDGSPFRKELLTPWLTATLVDFYINVVAISVWIVYKEAHWINALVWIVLLISFGSITTCAYIVVQLFQLSSQDPLYLVLLNSRDRNCGKEN